MIKQENITQAIKDSKITKIVMIDDAFDLPAVNSVNAGSLMDVFDQEDFEVVAAEAGAAAGDVEQARAALQNSQLGDEKLQGVLAALYEKYGETLDDRFNPEDIFGSQTANLRYVSPIIKLLRACKPVLTIIKYGSSDVAFVEAKEAELIFIDAFLESSVMPGTASDVEKNAAWKKSLDRVTKLITSMGQNAPSVILMSSAGEVRKKADAYRADMKDGKEGGRGLVFASRFGFLEKTRLKVGDSGRVTIETDAADDLLDIIQSFQFGRSMHRALDAWMTSAQAAAVSMRGELENLHLKDFAYLLRFRLHEEGSSLVQYLDWFFGECLLDNLGQKVDEQTGSEESVAFLEGKGAEQIEGAYEGATETVAELYHRVRIESPRKIRKPDEHKLGDLYVTGKKIYATMTPDCDLVVRPNTGRSAEQLLLVCGEIKDFDAPKTTVADFIMINKKPKNINWNPKKLETQPFDMFPDTLKYVGTLRPLYAQELQRRVLHDLGRVGVATAPAIGINASVSVHVQRPDGKREKISLPKFDGTECVVVPARAPSFAARIIFSRRFVPTLVKALVGLNTAQLAPHAAEHVEALKKDNALRSLEKMYKRSGVSNDETIAFGINLTANKDLKGKSDKTTWCWILIEMADEIFGQTLEAAV